MKPIVATYYLVGENGRIWSKIDVADNDRCLDGICYSAVSWEYNGDVINWRFVADVYCKFDSCTHWYFHGEDYDPNTDTEIDSYYHICGPGCFTEHIMNMCFVWKVAEMVLKDSYSGDSRYIECIEENYGVNGFTGELVTKLLEGYTITKG